MVGTSLFALSLLGLGAVRALPTKAVEERQFGIGGGGEGGSFTWGPGGSELPQCKDDIPASEQIGCTLSPISSGFAHPKRGFSLPPDYNTNTKEVIKQLERDLITLQNKRHKSSDDYSDIAALKSALKYLAGITAISAPPGGSSTFTPGKRFTLPPDYNSNTKEVIKQLERGLITLQNKRNKSSDDYSEISAIKSALRYLAGIVSISAPPGSSSSFTPGKREEAEADFDATGLQDAYIALLSSFTDTTPSSDTRTVLDDIANVLNLYGVSVDREMAFSGPAASTFVPRQDTITIGRKTCELADVMGLKAALAALITAYGDPATAPPNVFLIEQVIVSALLYCNQTVNGWTSLTPGNPIPGGPLKPDPYVPGGPMIPDPTTPGGPITPDPTTPGGPLKPDPTTPGGGLKPDPSNPGGPITPDPTTPGGGLKPPK
ncbi:hypothetical protein B0H67DRAFT_551804 [Lasiosphaeris hirsuta]|uniref:Uncharacterized protein n=1 Tax=Lasiosphaeris hirsuta TaxID=260670 RepID=A0AA40AP56_9PEZI|nr:hypothetical protein B0H67DRAFT_551804 [Lasiosphaeris hirsuta]